MWKPKGWTFLKLLAWSEFRCWVIFAAPCTAQSIPALSNKNIQYSLLTYCGYILSVGVVCARILTFSVCWPIHKSWTSFRECRSVDMVTDKLKGQIFIIVTHRKHWFWVKLALITFISTFTTAVDNSTICTNILLLFLWNFVPFWCCCVTARSLGECFILQGKVATLISWGGLSLYC